jgi:hypothetical protein
MSNLTTSASARHEIIATKRDGLSHGLQVPSQTQRAELVPSSVRVASAAPSSPGDSRVGLVPGHEQLTEFCPVAERIACVGAFGFLAYSFDKINCSPHSLIIAIDRGSPIVDSVGRWMPVNGPNRGGRRALVGSDARLSTTHVGEPRTWIGWSPTRVVGRTGPILVSDLSK